MAQNKQIRSLSERAENTFRTLPKCTFDLKSGFWIFFKNIFCMIFFNTRLQLAEEKNRHLFKQVLGKEWNRSSLIRLQTKLSSTFACFGEDNDDTFSPFSGIYSPSSCWEICSVASQWNSDDFCFFYFLDWTSESWEKWILVRLRSDDGDADHRRTILSRTKILQTESNFH